MLLWISFNSRIPPPKILLNTCRAKRLKRRLGQSDTIINSIDPLNDDENIHYTENKCSINEIGDHRNESGDIYNNNEVKNDNDNDIDDNNNNDNYNNNDNNNDDNNDNNNNNDNDDNHDDSNNDNDSNTSGKNSNPIEQYLVDVITVDPFPIINDILIITSFDIK